MLSEVYDLALLRAEELRRRAEEEWVSEDVVKKHWVCYRPTWRKVAKLCGVDGGRNYEEYRGYVVYVIDAEAVIYRGEEVEEPVKLLEVDVLTPHRYVEERIRTHCEALELKAGLKALEERGVERVLFDGSLISMLIKPLYAERGRGLPGIEDFIHRLEELDPAEPRIASKELWPRLKEVYGGETGRALSFLGGVEKLLVLKKLLEVGREKLVFISKHSRGIDYFNSFKPDLALFQQATKEVGYSEPSEILIGSKVKRRLPVHAKFFKSLKLTLFYARLAEAGPVLRFEVPKPAGRGMVEEVLDELSPYVVAGYPYPLSKAHLDVEVGDVEVEKVARILGLHRVEGVGLVG